MKPTNNSDRQLAVRILLLICGLLLISFGVAVFNKANLGFDPFMAFDSGASKTLGISLGAAHILINLALLVLYLLLRKKKYINIGTLLALTITGPFIDIFTKLLNLAVRDELLLAVRISLVIFSCPLIGLGVYLYTGVRIGAGPNDLAAVILSDMTHKPYGLIRVLVDGLWLVFGVVLGGTIGIGTLFSLCFVGCSVQLWLKLKLFANFLPHDGSSCEEAQSFLKLI